MRYLSHPKASDIPQLKRIWCEGFPDDKESYCDFYFERHFSPERCLVVYNGIEAESAIHWFDSYYKGSDGNKYDFIFIYAAATLKKYRGHNNLKYMVEGCRKFASDSGKSGIVAAAADELAYLYDKWGFIRISQMHTYSANTAPGHGSVIWKVCPFDEFMSMREDYLDRLGNCFYWHDDAAKYMYDDIFTKGQVLMSQFEGRNYFAVCTFEKDRIIIRETNFPAGKFVLLSESISKYNSYSGKIAIYTHEKVDICSGNFTEEDIYYGHYRLISKFPGSENLGNAYINLIAD